MNEVLTHSTLSLAEISAYLKCDPQNLQIALTRLPVAGRVIDYGSGHRLTAQPDPRVGFSELMDLADCAAAADPKVSRETQEFLPAHVPGQGAGIQ
jgi:hypothetical protein